MTTTLKSKKQLSFAQLRELVAFNLFKAGAILPAQAATIWRNDEDTRNTYRQRAADLLNLLGENSVTAKASNTAKALRAVDDLLTEPAHMAYLVPDVLPGAAPQSTKEASLGATGGGKPVQPVPGTKDIVAKDEEKH